jgi:Predicted acetyltransferases and hydrolases with the alpha/beta hydrolase fold
LWSASQVLPVDATGDASNATPSPSPRHHHECAAVGRYREPVTADRQRTVFRDLGYALLDTVFLVGWHAVGARLHSARARHPIRHPSAPVVMLPGVHESPRFLDPLAAVLRATGRPVHTVPELGHNRATVVDTALSVRSYLERERLTGVTIVAHSKGGLVGKQLMMWPETSPRIRSMIAIATPFGGSRYARYAPSRVLRAFSPADATLLELAANQDANARILSVAAAIDPQIPNGSVLRGARNVTLPLSGHFRPLGDRRLHLLLLRTLSSEVANRHAGH